ncbi:MAG: 2-amino-4-hydroxy-6-hydroxymethyldihydropteridine diphosphokinase [Desulfobacterales bacterium]|nr:2-amino-4-hydroxy-6-hydroxymethyldihydropteridine diphosphokinase [Desulfobacterales bacterium]
MKQKHTVYISIGSNIDNKLKNCQNGITALAKPGLSFLKKQSPFYSTEPVDYKNQDWFINAVVKIQSVFDPYQLLSVIKSVQKDAGRISNPVRYGPRVLDLDILLYDDLVINLSGLVIPHPRMHKRRFVLKPICDIDPTVVHPVLKKDMRHLLDNLGDGQKIFEYR